MNSYTFLLGKTPLLSIAEICSIFDEDKIDDISKETLSLSTEEKINPLKLQNSLGGSLKIIETIKTLNLKEDLNQIINTCSSILIDENSNKINFALNIYNDQQNYSKLLKTILPQIKKSLKNEKINSRFINKNFQNLSSASTYNSVFKAKNIEINIIYEKEKIRIGKTISIQDIDAYSNRDYKRPARDSFSGMIPPKLAQIMINLSKVTKEEIIYDPFCGSGTILMESLRQQINSIGSDISEKAVKDSEKNLQWIFSNKKIESTYEVFLNDASKSIKCINKGNFHIVTEPYLGPPLSKNQNEEKIKEIQNELKKLLIDFFNETHKSIKKNQNIIIIFPFIKSNNKKYFLKIDQEIEKIGFQSHELIPKNIQEKFKLNINSYKSLIYERKNQVVGREIWKFQKTK